MVAMMYGPLMLAAVNPPERLVASSKALADMEPAKGAMSEFECEVDGGWLRMRPWYRLQRERYGVYFSRPAKG
jgi:hypothetical protein